MPPTRRKRAHYLRLWPVGQHETPSAVTDIGATGSQFVDPPPARLGPSKVTGLAPLRLAYGRNGWKAAVNDRPSEDFGGCKYISGGISGPSSGDRGHKFANSHLGWKEKRVSVQNRRLRQVCEPVQRLPVSFARRLGLSAPLGSSAVAKWRLRQLQNGLATQHDNHRGDCED